MLNFQGATSGFDQNAGSVASCEKLRKDRHIIPGGDCFRGSTLKLYTIDFMTSFSKELENAGKNFFKKVPKIIPPQKKNFLRFGLWRILDNKIQLVLGKNMLISDKVPIESKPTYLDIECALYHICWYKNMLQTNWESFYQVFAVFHPSPSRPPKKQKNNMGNLVIPVVTSVSWCVIFLTPKFLLWQGSRFHAQVFFWIALALSPLA